MLAALRLPSGRPAGLPEQPGRKRPWASRPAAEADSVMEIPPSKGCAAAAFGMVYNPLWHYVNTVFRYPSPRATRGGGIFFTRAFAGTTRISGESRGHNTYLREPAAAFGFGPGFCRASGRSRRF